MRKLINNNKKSAPASVSVRQAAKTKNMKKEMALPLIAGIVLGALLMLFWQFNVRLNSVRAAVTQLDQATAQNTKNLNDVITFLNNASGANQPAGQEAPVVTE
jgi:uncharacterized membrane protein YvbJ